MPLLVVATAAKPASTTLRAVAASQALGKHERFRSVMQSAQLRGEFGETVIDYERTAMTTFGRQYGSKWPWRTTCTIAA